VVKPRPAPPLEVIEPNFVLEVLVVALDAPIVGVTGDAFANGGGGGGAGVDLRPGSSRYSAIFTAREPARERT